MSEKKSIISPTLAPRIGNMCSITFLHKYIARAHFTQQMVI